MLCPRGESPEQDVARVDRMMLRNRKLADSSLEGLNYQVVPFKSPADAPAMPGMLRKSTAFVPRYQKFESISLQRRVMGELGPGSTSALREKALRSRSCAAWLRSSSGEVPRRTRSIWQPMSGRNRRRRAAAAPKATTSPIRRELGAGTPRRCSRTAPPSMLYAPLDDAGEAIACFLSRLSPRRPR